MGTHSNCLDKLRQFDKSGQFKSVPTEYAFLTTIRNEYRVSIINNPLMKFSVNLSVKCALIRCIFYLKDSPSNFEKPKRTVR